MPKRADIDLSELLEMLGKGWTEKEAAKHYGCSDSTITNRLRELGISLGLSSLKDGVKLHNGYVVLFRPEHSRATIDGYVPRGIVNWEAANGRPWPKGADMHHKDLDKLNDDADNIQPKTHSEHTRLHHNIKKGRPVRTEAANK